MRLIASLPREDQNIDPLVEKSPQHPKLAGAIVFDRVNLRYTPDANLALNNLTFKIPAGKRVGVCGRSGSGKSSTLSALFRMHDIESGTITGDYAFRSSRCSAKTLLQLMASTPWRNRATTCEM